MRSSDPTFPFLVADIGGTNARFALITGLQKAGDVCIAEQTVYACGEFESFEQVLATYLAEIEQQSPNSACIAIAGPVNSDRIEMTNLNWAFSVTELGKQFGFQRVEVINDFGAQAYATLYLSPNEIQTLHPGTLKPDAARAIIGPGTGLGVAGLIKVRDSWYPLCGEGGHMSYQPADEVEIKIRQAIAPFATYLSIEKLVSGPGLVNIYRAISQIKGAQPEFTSPADISSAAIKGSDPSCMETIALFYKILGRAAGDIVLATGAFGGLYLAGGILPQLANLISDSPFLDSFKNKGGHSWLLENTPIHLVVADEPALRGAAHWLLDR